MIFSNILSLYSTATQNTWRWGFALGNAPDARIMRQLTQKIPTCWYLKTRKHPTPNLKFASPNAKPKRKSVEYRLRCVPNAKFLRWACTFHVVCVNFICVWEQTQTRFSVEYGLKTYHIFYSISPFRFRNKGSTAPPIRVVPPFTTRRRRL